MASRINWRGKPANMLTVGKSNWTDFRTINSALDSITDNASDNRYVVMLAHDRTTEQIIHTKSYVDIAGESRWWSIVERPPSDVVSGGTIQAYASSASYVLRDFGFYGLRVVRNISGGFGAAGPPEAGLFIGQESTWPTSDVPWTDCTVADCVIEGVHDGIQTHGMKFDAVTEIPRLISMHNQIRCCHDGVTYKGLVRATHVGDDVQVRSQGFAPYLDDIEDWKHTGLHVNFDFPQIDGAAVDVPSDAFVDMTGCNLFVEDGTNTAPTLYQSAMAGVYLYDLSGNSNAGAYRWSYPIRINGCSIKVRADSPTTHDRGFAGVMAWQGSDAEGCQVPADNLLISGCSISIDQENASGPTAVAGVHIHGADNATATNTATVVGCSITGSNANGTAYCLQADNQSDTITAKVYSDLATNIDAAATLTAATVRP